MHRIVVSFCLFWQVISGSKYHRHVNYRVTRVPRMPSVTSENGYVFNQFGDSSGMYAMFANENTKHNPYTDLDPFEIKSSVKLGLDTPQYTDLSNLPEVITDRIPTRTVSPMIYDSEYEISKAKSDAKYSEMVNKYRPLHVKSDVAIENLKSMMHYAPPEHDMKDSFSSYEFHTDYHNDDDDVRSSGRSMYDSYWPHIYHSPYEYEYKKVISDVEKAKDKRYVDNTLEVKPIYEHIDDDIPKYPTDQQHIEAASDNPITGNGPFFSFVLNDYFDRNTDEDPLSFKGLDVDWGKEFDHESYKPSIDDILSSKRNRRLKDSNFSPVDQWLTTTAPQYVHLKTSGAEYTRGAGTELPGTTAPFTSVQTYSPLHHPSHESLPSDLSHNYLTSAGGSHKEEGMSQNNDSENHNIGKNKYSHHKTGYGTDNHKYAGFKDFLDSFANKFGSEDHKKDSSYQKQNNQDTSQKKKGFHRVYHKDEFQEDNEFYDNSNNTFKSQEKGRDKVHIGGSEAILRSQALASVGNAANTMRKSGNVGEGNIENLYKDGSNSKGNKFVKFIDVAKQAAQSNSADYLDNFRA